MSSHQERYEIEYGATPNTYGIVVKPPIGDFTLRKLIKSLEEEGPPNSTFVKAQEKDRTSLAIINQSPNVNLRDCEPVTEIIRRVISMNDSIPLDIYHNENRDNPRTKSK